MKKAQNTPCLIHSLSRIVKDVKELEELEYTEVETGKTIKTVRSAAGMINAQLQIWCKELKDNATAQKICDELFALEIGAQTKCTRGLSSFLTFMSDTILNQVKALMTKYEERFLTLPEDILSMSHKGGSRKIVELLQRLDNQEIVETVADDKKEEFLASHMNGNTSEVLAFWRHEDSNLSRTIKDGASNNRKEVNLLYREPLSGAQSYLNSFETLYDGDATEVQQSRFILKLLETGLTKVLLIDERVKKFEKEHSNVKATFADVGISTLDDECSETNELFDCAQSNKHSLDIEIDNRLISDFDIVVIHQGIIDKKLEDHNNPKKIRAFIEYLKSEIRYIVVTTGRGNPANIPNDVRVLPFSVIESTLFKKYPEKMILVDAIMNLLPSGGEE